ncbi:hypothetical protein HDU98_009256 [Podochytrium sp. JEL0797]|nr:hypothetical protein HDU98_009256 [Podochytrium sp. JEL0797]
MYTKTSKSVIAPLAEAVSSLVLIISEAEINHSPMPDLSVLAKVVDDQISHLTGVGLRIAQQAVMSDTQLKEEMPESCDLVKKSSELLVSATETLAKDPFSSLGRNSLLEGVKGILKNTAHILSVMDDLEVRRLLTSLAHLRDDLAALPEKESELSDLLPPAIASITGDANGVPAPPAPIRAPASQSEIEKWETQWCLLAALFSQSFVGFSQMCLKRAGELIDQNLQKRLRNAIDVLTRESSMLLSTCRVVVSQSGPAQSKVLLNMSCNRMSIALDEVEAVIRTKLEEDFNFDQAVAVTGGLQMTNKQELAATQNMEDLIMEIKYILGAKDGNPYAAMTDLLNLSNSIIVGTTKFMHLVTDPLQRSALQTQLDAVQKADAETVTAAKFFAVKPDSIQTQQDLGHKLAQSRNAHNLLRFLKNRLIVSEITSSNLALMDTSTPTTATGLAFEAAQKGNRNKLTLALQGFENEVARWTSLVECVQQICPFADQAVADQVAEGVKTTLSLVPMITAGANLVCMSPTDEAACAHLERTGKVWADNIQDAMAVARTNFSPLETASGLRHCFAQHTDGIVKAIVKGNTEMGVSEALASVACAGRFAAAVKRTFEAIQDPAYRLSLETRFQELERVLPHFTAKAKQLIDTKKLIESDDLLSCIKDLSSRFLAIEDVMRVRNESLINVYSIGEVAGASASDELEAKKMAVEGISVQVLETGVDAIVIDAEPPKPLSEAEAKADPIQAAAQEIKVEASQWSPTENQIIEASTKISDHMSSLAKFHKQLGREFSNPEAKKGFILCAKSIHAESLKIVQNARPIADACVDLRLQKQLQGSLQWIENLAQQLKIVAAVKCSAPADTDKDQQLIACARNIMVAVKNCIRDSEAGSLRVPVADAAERRASAVAVFLNRASIVQAERKKSVSSQQPPQLPKKPVIPVIKFRRNLYRPTGAAR